MQFVYALVSREGDPFADMAALSIWLVRRLHPEATVAVVCDPETRSSIEARGEHPLLELVDRWIEHAIDVSSLNARAKLLKGRMRRLVEGDYLFLDADALPVARLDEAFAIRSDFAAVYDRHLGPGSYTYLDGQKQRYPELGWHFPESYYNTGVVYVRDTPSARAFCDHWARLIEEVALPNGMKTDQQPFNETMARTPTSIETLPGEWNVQVHLGEALPFLRRSKVLHFFSFPLISDAAARFVISEPLVRLSRGEGIDTAALETLLRTRYPWTDASYVQGQWAAGRYGSALAAAAGKLLQRAGLRRAQPTG